MMPSASVSKRNDGASIASIVNNSVWICGRACGVSSRVRWKASIRATSSAISNVPSAGVLSSALRSASATTGSLCATVAIETKVVVRTSAITAAGSGGASTGAGATGALSCCSTKSTLPKLCSARSTVGDRSRRCRRIERPTGDRRGNTAIHS
jgi:hypothetical protein